MSTVRAIGAVGPGLLVLACQILGPSAVRCAPAAAEEAERAWSFSASAYGYFVPDESDFVQPSFRADRGWLHLEARYNYEAQDAGSLWVGANFSGGAELTWGLTPILGGVFGETEGVAPGYEGWLGWWRLELYSEGEYVFDTGDSSGSFFYNWSELTIAPAEWLRVGVVTQRTRARETDREIERGLLVAFSYRKLEWTACVFDPDDAEPTWVAAVAVEF